MTAELAKAAAAYGAGDYISALTVLSTLLDDRRDIDVLTLLGETFEKLGLSGDAIDVFAQAIDLGPAPQALRRAAHLSLAAGDHARAQLYGMKLLELAPDDGDIARLLAASFHCTGDHMLARHLRPHLVESDQPDHVRLACDLYADEDRDPAALTVFAKFAALHPDDPYAQFKYLSVARDFCDYDAIETLETAWRKDIKAGTPAVLAGETPYSNLLHCADERLNRLARNAGLPPRPPASLIDRHRPVLPKRLNGRIRIGYLSNDFWSDHATMRLLQTVLERHDRAEFDVTLYCYTPERFTASETMDRSRWGRIVPVHDLSDAEVAAAIRRDGIDILVDLKGHTGGARAGILNWGAAPVQVAWLGFPGSVTGVDCDYVIGDPVVLPLSSAPFYHEHFCRLPETYQPNDPVHRARPEPMNRADLGLPEGRFVFAAFNAARKISVATLDAWATILGRTPASVLWVMIDGSLAQANFLKAMGKRGIGADRVVFAPKTRYEDHIARLPAADLGLDTFPYNGHTTTSDQIWAGLPVLTVRGTNFASRVSESLLNAIGIPDLVACDREDFIYWAVALATQPEAMRAYRNTIAANRFTAPLFDAERFCRHLESALVTMARRSRAGLPPESFDVPALPVRSEAFQ